MGKLIVHSNEFPGLEFALATGSNSVGRSPGNTIEIPHSSISGQHGEIAEDPNGWLIVRDHGSTNGTFYQNQQVTEAFVSPGERFQLGHLEVEYEALPVAEPVAPPIESAVPIASPAPVANPEPVTAPAVEQTTFTPRPPDLPSMPATAEEPAKRSGKPCKKHPDNDEKYVCPQCRVKMCVQCVNLVELNGKSKKYCPTCKVKCKSINKDKADQKAQQAKENRSFRQCLPEILKYPVRGSSLPLMLIGSFMFVFAEFAALFHIGIAIAVVGYLFVYMQKIIIASAAGDEELPNWPEFSDLFNDIFIPFCKLIWTLLISFGPYLIYMIDCVGKGADINMGILFPLFAWGLLYFPMALLAVAMADSFMAANPFVVLPSITRIPSQYIVVCVAFFGMISVRYVTERLVDIHLGIPIVSTILISFLSLYFLAVEMRMLGVMYHLNRRRLGWFKRS